MGRGFRTSRDTEELLSNLGSQIISRIREKAGEIAGDNVITPEHIIQATYELGLERSLHHTDSPDPQESRLDRALREYRGREEGV